MCIRDSVPAAASLGQPRPDYPPDYQLGPSSPPTRGRRPGGGAVCAGAATIGTAALQAYSPQQPAGPARLGRGPGEPVAGAPPAQQSGVSRETGASPRANPDSTAIATSSRRVVG